MDELNVMKTSLETPAATSARALPDWVKALYGANKPTGVVADLLAERAAAGRAETRK